MKGRHVLNSSAEVASWHIVIESKVIIAGATEIHFYMTIEE